MQVPAHSFPQTASISEEICISGRPCNTPLSGWQMCWLNAEPTAICPDHHSPQLNFQSCCKTTLATLKTPKVDGGEPLHQKRFLPACFHSGKLPAQAAIPLLQPWRCPPTGRVREEKELHTRDNSPPFHPKTSKPLEVLGETLHRYRQGKPCLGTAGTEPGTFCGLPKPDLAHCTAGSRACRTARKALQYPCKQRASGLQRSRRQQEPTAHFVNKKLPFPTAPEAVILFCDCKALL